MADYSKMTDTDFDTYLERVIESYTARQLAAIPGVMDVLLEELNNEVLDAWAVDNPELAYPEDYDEEETA